MSEVIEGESKPVTPKRVYRSAAEKRRIVEATFTPGTSIARVAREHGVNANQIFQWRCEYRKGILGDAKSRAKLLPVVVEEAAVGSVDRTAVSPSQKSAAICVEFPGGISVRVDSETDLHLLRTVVEMLRS